MELILTILSILALKLAGVLCPFEIITDWKNNEYRTIKSYELYTITECILRCEDDTECQLVGTKRRPDDKLGCFLLHRMDVEDIGQINGRDYGYGNMFDEERNGISLIREVSRLLYSTSWNWKMDIIGHDIVWEMVWKPIVLKLEVKVLPKRNVMQQFRKRKWAD